MALCVPHALLGPMLLGVFFVSLGVTLDSAETPFAKTVPLSLVPDFGSESGAEIRCQNRVRGEGFRAGWVQRGRSGQEGSVLPQKVLSIWMVCFKKPCMQDSLKDS